MSSTRAAGAFAFFAILTYYFARFPQLSCHTERSSTLIQLENDARWYASVGSGFFGLNGFGWPTEWWDIYVSHQLRQAELTAISKTVTPEAMGTFRLWRWWRHIRLLPNGDWINCHGFTQNGIAAEFPKLEAFCQRIGNPIINVCAWDQPGVDKLASYTNELNCVAVQFNHCCGNVQYISPELGLRLQERYCEKSIHPVGAKLGFHHTDSRKAAFVEFLYRAKLLKDVAAWLEAINTVDPRLIYPEGTRLPIEGVISGPSIKPIALEAADCITQTRWYEDRFVAGGGISNTNDVLEFLNLGVDAVAIGVGLHRDHRLARKASEIVMARDLRKEYGDQEDPDRLARLLDTSPPRNTNNGPKALFLDD